MAAGTFGLKEVQLLTVLIFGLTHGIPSGAGDVMCLVCDLVDHPSHCDTFGICGHWEVCSTRQIVDHHDKIGYRMGCESPEICELYRHAKEMFGRRRAVFEPSDKLPHHCFDCCSDNYCNVDLCDAANQTSPPVPPTTPGGVAVSTSGGTVVSGQTDFPQNQTVSTNTSMTNSTGNVYTTPTTANTSSTTIAMNTSSTTATTNTSTGASAVNTTTSANISTTATSGVNMTTTQASTKTPTITTTVPSTSPTTATTGTTTSNGCPSNSFIRRASTCYLFDMSTVNWDVARQSCQKQGADLVSVNTEEEDKLLVKLLSNMSPPDTTRGIWLGGYFDATVNHYVWVDGTDMTFQRFNGKSPRDQKDYRLLLINPSLNPLFVGWPWSSDVGALYKRGFVCEALAV